MDKIKIKMIEQLNNVVAQAEKIVITENFSDISYFDLMEDETKKLLEITNIFKRVAFPDKGDIKNDIFNLKNTLSQLQQKVVVADEPTAVSEQCDCRHSEDGAVESEVQQEARQEVQQEVQQEAVIQAEISEQHNNGHSEDNADRVISAAEIEQPVLDFTVEETSVAETLTALEPDSAEITVDSETVLTDDTDEITPVVDTAAEVPTIEVPIAEAPSAKDEAPAKETSHLLERLRSLSEENKSENTSTLCAMVNKLRDIPSMPEVHLEHPIDLRTSVGINEKFLFVNELFSGSIRECNEAMSFLNSLDDLESAMEQIHVYKEKFGWNENSVAYMTLEEVVNQRFSQLIMA